MSTRLQPSHIATPLPSCFKVARRNPPEECPYCSGQVELVGGKEIYPHRPDLFRKWFYLCRPCVAYVGCHPGTREPLGRLANAELREWKQRAHAAFDPIWKSGAMKRKAAYRWLSERLGLTENETHIGMFDVELCQRVVAVSKGWNEAAL